ncbi:hypothetical protein QWZ06_08510 [Chryseobacterium tructae]|jgi:hypothetical protein|uniref:TerB N-terminal domain-containing protein n=1 Tax=Chryseobacterium tructae TaxID=1037380 RepID=A0ABV7XXK8_9FLAO|nr:hypothetical protein [Chryseobacterium tructae]MDN3692303.1 hypothetical protein [Chryseobacterium tructae]
MTYATTYHIGNIQNAPRNQATAIAPPVKRVRKLDAKTQGRKRNQKGQTAVRTESYVANGFLKTSFLQRLEETETVQACRDNAKMERDFYTSLSQLAEHYGITPKPTQSLGYPYNIALALKDAEEQLKQKVKDWEEIRLVQDSKKTFFTTEERYSTGSTLYYIPVLPLYRWLKDPKRKHTAQLLLSVCSYLYHLADIPYYRQESSYLYWMYEMQKDWVTEDDYGEDTENNLGEFAQAEWIGDCMEKKIYHNANLKHFKERLDRFKAKDTIDKDCLKVAQEAYAIYQQYPSESILRNAKPNGEANEEDMENIISMEKYISFCADGKGWLMDNLVESVNNELQEYGQMEEPMIIKRFDGSDITANTLEFENRLLPMIDELTYILNNF